MSYFRFLLVLVFATPLALYSQPTKISLEKFSLSLQKPNDLEKLGVVVWDQREQVVDGRQRASLLGYTRSVTGIAYATTIKSKAPLADWLSGRITDSFGENGLATVAINTSANEKWSQIEAKMRATNVDRFLVLQLRKLQFDGIMKFSYMAEIDVEVYSNKAELLASVHISDERVMGGVGGWKKKFPLHLVSIVEDAVNNGEIFSALNEEQVTKEPSQNTKSTTAFDIIVTKKGDEIEAKVEEITSDAIKYRKSTQQDGPLRNIPKAEVFMIKYKDGTKELFQ